MSCHGTRSTRLIRTPAQSTRSTTATDLRSQHPAFSAAACRVQTEANRLRRRTLTIAASDVCSFPKPCADVPDKDPDTGVRLMAAQRCTYLNTAAVPDLQCEGTAVFGKYCPLHLREVRHLQIARSSIAGLGLFATHPFVATQHIALVTGDIVYGKEVKSRNRRMSENAYVVEWKSETYIDCSRTDTDVSRFANDNGKSSVAGANNAIFVVLSHEMSLIELRASRYIAAGEEITVEYGPSYWQGRH